MSITDRCSTPLHWAAMGNSINTAVLLLLNGAAGSLTVHNAVGFCRWQCL